MLVFIMTRMTTQSKTMLALDRIAAGEKVAVVAREVGISTAAIYAALKRRDGKNICPCCGQIMREGFTTGDSPLHGLTDAEVKHLQKALAAYRKGMKEHG